MCTKGIQRNWDNGLIIAFVSFAQNLIKFSLAIVELVYGHFRNASPNEERGLYCFFVKFNLNIFKNS